MKMAFLLFFMPISIWAQELVEPGVCKNNACFWVAKAQAQRLSKLSLQFSLENDCRELSEPAQEEMVQLQHQQMFQFNAHQLYAVVNGRDVHSLRLQIDDDEHCVPVHCHPSEESCLVGTPLVIEPIF